MLGWAIVAVAALAAAALVGGVLWEAARTDGWSKTLWGTAALIGIATVVTLAALALNALVT